MRLINVRALLLEEYFGDEIPPYAILSHTWGKEEISFEELGSPLAVDKQGYEKIKSACRVALKDGHNYIWVDTCCIDKRSSAELSEAINSMCAWYQSSSVCYAYLVDVQPRKAQRDPFGSRWWSRGWTLQELLAPANVLFLDKDWNCIGTKKNLSAEITHHVGISGHALASLNAARSMSIAERMSWASNRATTRVEDRAYSLLGLFDVNMSLLYGEGMKAFARLQEEIIKISADQSIFAWGLADDIDMSSELFGFRAHRRNPFGPIGGHTLSDPLAKSPELFSRSRGISQLTGALEPTMFGITNLGIQVRIPIADTASVRWRTVDYCIGILACTLVGRDEEFLGILLRVAPDTSRCSRLQGDNGAKSTFLFSTNYFIDAVVRDVLLRRLLDPDVASDSSGIARKSKGVASRLAIKLDPIVAGIGCQLDKIFINNTSVLSYTEFSGFMGVTNLVLNLDHWREKNVCSMVMSLASEEQLYKFCIETHRDRLEDSICYISWMTREADLERPILLTMNETPRLPLGSKELGTETRKLDVVPIHDLHVKFHYNTVLLQQIFILSIIVGPLLQT